MHHRVLTAVLAIGMVAILGGCTDSQPRSTEPPRKHYEEAGGFSYDPPPGWKVGMLPGMKYRIARGPVSNGFAPNINVVEEAANVALSEYVEGNIKAIKKQFVGLKILTRDQILTFDNQPSERVVTENIQQGRKLRQTFYFFGTGKRKYVFTCTAPASGGASLDPIFQKSAVSFRFH